MNFKTNTKYFTQKNYMLYIGGAVAAVGVIILLLGWWAYMAVGIIIVGIALAIFGREGMVKGDELDRQTLQYGEDMKDRIIEKYHLNKATANIITFVQYCYDGETSLSMKKGNDGKFRPKKFMSTAMFIMNSSLCIDKEIVSLCEEKVENSSGVYAFAEISKLEIEDKKLEENGGLLLSYHALAVLSKDGEVLTEALMPPASTLYETVESCNREIKAAHRAEKQ